MFTFQSTYSPEKRMNDPTANKGHILGKIRQMTMTTILDIYPSKQENI